MKELIDRTDVGIILIAQSSAERVRSMIVEHTEDEEKLAQESVELKEELKRNSSYYF